MFPGMKCLFENKENLSEFKNLCEKLKHHPFQSPWIKESTNNDLFEFYLSETTEEIKIPFNCEESCLLQSSSEGNKDISKTPEQLEVKLLLLKESLMTVQDPHAIQEIKGLEILYSLSLNEVSLFCDTMKSSLLEDEVLAMFVNAVLKIEKPLSLSVASLLVHHILYPLGFELNMNSSRNLLASILNFSEIYPKAVIDEIILPCLNKDNLDSLHFDTLMKMTKSNLPNECTYYFMKGILDSASPSDNTFSVLQGIIERKNELDKTMKDKLAWKLKTWSSDFKSSVKFTKMVIGILTIYGSELSDQLIIYNEIIEENRTIMKRAAESVLKKLRKRS